MKVKVQEWTKKKVKLEDWLNNRLYLDGVICNLS